MEHVAMNANMYKSFDAAVHATHYLVGIFFSFFGLCIKLLA